MEHDEEKNAIFAVNLMFSMLWTSLEHAEHAEHAEHEQTWNRFLNMKKKYLNMLYV